METVMHKTCTVCRMPITGYRFKYCSDKCQREAKGKYETAHKRLLEAKKSSKKLLEDTLRIHQDLSQMLKTIMTAKAELNLLLHRYSELGMAFTQGVEDYKEVITLTKS